VSVTEWAVIAGGLAAIAWVNWYFFLAERAGRSAGPPSDGLGDRGAHDGSERS
jgi:hypothetical protein